VIGALLPAIERHGLGTARELDVPTLGARLAAELASHEAVFSPPALAGAWGHRP
jgi:hypothetical protein